MSPIHSLVSAVCLGVPLLAANCGHTTTQGNPPTASPDTSAEPTTPATSNSTASADTATPAPSVSGEVALPPGSAKPWNNAQSDGASPAIDRGIADYTKIVQDNRDKFRTCYDASLAAHPGISGRVNLTFVLNVDGTIKESSIDKSASDITEPDLERCLGNVLKTLKFPRSKKGMESTVHYPFTFKPGSKK